MNILIRSNGSVTNIVPRNSNWELDELYKELNCEMVQIVYPRRKIDGFRNPIMICDEEGLIANKDFNFHASILAGTQIVGDVIICENKNFK